MGDSNNGSPVESLNESNSANGKNGGEHETPNIEIVIKRHQQLFTLLSKPKMM